MAGDQGVPHDEGVAEARERVRLGQEIDHEDAADFAVAERFLQNELGNDYEQTKRLLEQHLAQLPPEERARLAVATVHGGASVLHDPTTLRSLIRQAVGPMPRTSAAARAELAEARRRMREEPSKWFADDRAQLRYRQLVRALEGGR